MTKDRDPRLVPGARWEWWSPSWWWLMLTYEPEDRGLVAAPVESAGVGRMRSTDDELDGLFWPGREGER